MTSTALTSFSSCASFVPLLSSHDFFRKNPCCGLKEKELNEDTKYLSRTVRFVGSRLLYKRHETKMKSALPLLLVVSSASAFSFTQPMPRVSSAGIKPSGASSLRMISDGSDRMERKSLDISKTTYVSLVKAPKDAYMAVSHSSLG
jgi:hypothetical protein